MTTARTTLLSCILLAFSATTPVRAADVEGSQDHPMISRYGGSEIVRYEVKEFDSYTLPVSRSEGMREGPQQTQAL